MSIKSAVKPYYHYLYRTLKVADANLHKNNEEEMVHVMIEDIVRLDALVSLLVYVDNTLPLIRCQKAFAKLKSELDNLYYLYREQKVIGHKHHETLGWQIGKAIDLDIAIMAQTFMAQSNDLYLNTIHSTEKILGKHINLISDQDFQVGIMAYFTDCLEEIEAFDLNERIEEVGYLIRGLLANLHFIAYIANNKETLNKKAFFEILSDTVGILKTMHIYQRSLKSMGTNNPIVGKLAGELQLEYDNQMKKLEINYSSVIAAKDDILTYVKNSIINKGSVSGETVRASIHARNLLHSLT